MNHIKNGQGMEKFRYPLVKVIWDDAESASEWQEEPHAPLKATLALAVGFLVRDEPDYILMADTYFLEGRVIGNTTKIPRGMVKEITPLILSKPRIKRVKREVKSDTMETGNTKLQFPVQ